MVEHMRTEEAPSFINAQADSSHGSAPKRARKGSTGKP
jgi:hypothetical protein